MATFEEVIQKRTKARTSSSFRHFYS